MWTEVFERANARPGHAEITINLVVTLRSAYRSHAGRIFGIDLRTSALQVLSPL